MAIAGGALPDFDIGFGGAHVSINSPYAVARLVVSLTAFAMVVVAAVMGRAVQEDVEYRTAGFFACAPITKTDYLLGRFLGAYGVVAVILAAMPLGAYLATLLPTLDHSRLEANQWLAYSLPLPLPGATRRTRHRRHVLLHRRNDPSHAAGLRRQRPHHHFVDRQRARHAEHRSAPAGGDF